MSSIKIEFTERELSRILEACEVASLRWQHSSHNLACTHGHEIRLIESKLLRAQTTLLRGEKDAVSNGVGGEVIQVTTPVGTSIAFTKKPPAHPLRGTDHHAFNGS